MFDRLRAWIRSDRSETLWICGPSDPRYPSGMSTIAATVIRLFAKSEPTVIFHFCDLPSQGELRSGVTVEEQGVISLVYSLIQQLVLHLQPTFKSDVDFSEHRFASLSGSIESVSKALKLVKDLVPFCLPYIIFVNDGLERLDYDVGQAVCEELLITMREVMAQKNSVTGSNSICKVLYTTSGTSRTLMRGLDIREILMQDNRKDLIHNDRLTRGKTVSADLEDLF